MEYRNLLIEKHGAVAALTVNRPTVLNSLNSAVLDELLAAFSSLGQDEGVRAIVLTGSGEKAFVAGADIAEMADLSAMQAQEFSRKGQQLVNLIGRLAKPVIAAVNGFALGGGLEMVLACDFAYASENAKLGLPEVTLGIIPGFGGTQKLARLIGRSRANELIFTGRMLTAAEAKDWGVVNAVFPGGELVAKAMETAAKIAANGQLGVAHAKDAVKSGLDMAEADGMNYESVHFGALFSTADQREGMRAFLEKRKPVFSGR
ncbi:enoyl-CoA hydratase/isomerase [Geotalea daltonii FRC-32]|uniref:Enoyl-CoA hydratase/isomerase n=1 Tax=Geotalea daltonii (strain DSM 22248 / JCM 15807 / FRC-32) TaxID=316067 RepID=B9M959_GEODF|nr:enoyl-CoA hydratase-related protein [Geotalea daltonii]ACM18617.1 enoyl-CoA hydratase/isomerase [Geotalea daltonii FRC-32]